MTNSEDPSYVKTVREYDTPDDLKQVTAQDLLDNVDIDLAHQVLTQYYSNKDTTNIEHWSDWYSMSMSSYGQMTIAADVRKKFGITSGDTLRVQMRYKGTQVETTYTVGNDTSRFNIGESVRNELGHVPRDEVSYRVTME